MDEIATVSNWALDEDDEEDSEDEDSKDDDVSSLVVDDESFSIEEVEDETLSLTELDGKIVPQEVKMRTKVVKNALKFFFLIVVVINYS